MRELLSFVRVVAMLVAIVFMLLFFVGKAVVLPERLQVLQVLSDGSVNFYTILCAVVVVEIARFLQNRLG